VLRRAGGPARASEGAVGQDRRGRARRGLLFHLPGQPGCAASARRRAGLFLPVGRRATATLRRSLVARRVPRAARQHAGGQHRLPRQPERTRAGGPAVVGGVRRHDAVVRPVGGAGRRDPWHVGLVARHSGDAETLGRARAAGHTFHYSRCESPLEPVRRTEPARGGASGAGEVMFRSGSVQATYFHAWFASSPAATASLFLPGGTD